jgi:hypothetical protein
VSDTARGTHLVLFKQKAPLSTTSGALFRADDLTAVAAFLATELADGAADFLCIDSGGDCQGSQQDGEFAFHDVILV